MIEAVVRRISQGTDLSLEEMAEVVDVIMQGQCGEQEMADLLTGLRVKGETVDEIAGAAWAMRRRMTPIRTSRSGVVDTCGTGGDGSGTFNISTVAALIAAAAGVPVAKHGNRGVSSKSGSADVLAALGVNIEAPVETVRRCLDELGICFCFAPQLHPSMKHVAAVRRRLGVPTIFNLLGPLCNPAAAPYQLLGVGRPDLRSRLAAALTRLDTQRALVVCGEDGLDEVTLGGATRVTEVCGETTRQWAWHPSDFGLPSADKQALRADSPQESGEIIREILEGKAGPCRDVAVANAAAAIHTADPSSSLAACAQRAADAVDQGAARKLLAQLVEASNR